MRSVFAVFIISLLKVHWDFECFQQQQNKDKCFRKHVILLDHHPNGHSSQVWGVKATRVAGAP